MSSPNMLTLSRTVDEDGHIKNVRNLKDHAAVAWSKVHAVYPKLDAERLSRMNVDQILSSDRREFSVD